MNRISALFASATEPILNVYTTAGFPRLEDTMTVLNALQAGGVDIIEVGMPYSDPVADGETIQLSNQAALEQGMSVAHLFEQLKDMRKSITVPVLLMGYINPVLQYGVEAFCAKCAEVGVDGLILPDLPMVEYEASYREIFEKYGLFNILLITPQTNDERIRHIDSVSRGFIYMVSSASTTGAKTGISSDQELYFERIAAMNLQNPRLIGFGISDHESFVKASKNASGAIIGSAFVKMIAQAKDLSAEIVAFVQSIKGKN
ncbi:tryptophan synthase subunit alpha [Aquirufa antheringensis]|jgi:tryptophan synthase alpha chain|uniref:Tryptophan synthase alpha chain n=1 Tax=Aquirufa antheringensis TaxID=2516559 RepID=A0A4V2IVZ8_9BACT|nr:tryptophan synthase subunit alpha [Aquirufa antheringensis]MCZ2487518.1 tryptophan synthase subunit alpha [Aquirufa antheringensis]TBH74185.1 tryptophan synthase subunit alpha [Aquirufa antheringensis]